MQVSYFGEIADVTNKTSEHITLSANTVSALIAFLITTYEINEKDMHIAINRKLVSKTDDIQINNTDEVAVLSAFAGG